MNMLPSITAVELHKLALNRLFKLKGLDLDKTSKEELADQILAKEREIDRLTTKKPYLRKLDFFYILFRDLNFSKKQKQLLKALISCKPTRESLLIKKTRVKTENNSKANLKMLILETKERFKEYKIDKTIAIKPLRGKPFNGYQMSINSDLLNYEVV